ncbi:MAG: glycosyltransferase family 39 protein [Caulobacteraceae bacterium]
MADNPAESTQPGSTAGASRHWRNIVLFLSVLTVWRIVAVFASPLDLYPDEAQYWLWSRTFDFGYFSKPPMVAWLIGLTTISSSDEAFVRLAAPLMHALAALALYGAGRRLHGPAAGALAAVLYALMPGVQLSSFVIATDAPLLAFLSLAFFAYVELQAARGRRALAVAAGFGAALGLAFLSKYAALYALAGLTIHLIADRDARKVWRLPVIGTAAFAFLVIASPNLIWNATHGFETVAHTAGNAGWSEGEHFQIAELAGFLVAQFGVFGPIPFAVLALALVLAVRRGLTKPDVLALAFTLPPLIVVTAQAFIAGANANWAAAAYTPGAVLVAGLLVRWKARPWIIAAMAIQGLIAILFLFVIARPDLADRIGMANSLKRARGWEQITRLIVERARDENAAGQLTAVAVEDRFLFNAAAYYGRDAFGADLPPLRMWVRGAAPRNQAEAVAALTPAEGGRVLAVSLAPDATPVLAADFARTLGKSIISVRLDAKHSRRAEMFIGEAFAPKPRTGPDRAVR